MNELHIRCREYVQCACSQNFNIKRFEPDHYVMDLVTLDFKSY
jgi:hypothetical protein